jgi:endonuclease/exonuclease/phosphatase family metal-dependent hydrolase
MAIIRGKADAGEPAVGYTPAILGGLLLLAPFGLLLAWQCPETVTPAPDNTTVRVMDYNLHNGFNTDGRLDMEALARVIEENNPDVIGLQEVSRGWLINGRVDMLQWLSCRLDMPYIAGPTDGAQWGNAILSRYPVIESETHPLPPESLRLRRGYIKAEIDIGGNTFQLIDTHLHHVGGDSDIRQEQVPGLVSAWNKAPRTLLVGDLNAEPDSPEMQTLFDAGLVDVSGVYGPSPGYTYYSADLYQRIDYLLASPDLVIEEFRIPQSTASDHLPLVTTLMIP